MAWEEIANASMKLNAGRPARSIHQSAPAISEKITAIQPTQTKTVAIVARRSASFWMSIRSSPPVGATPDPLTVPDRCTVRRLVCRRGQPATEPGLTNGLHVDGGRPEESPEPGHATTERLGEPGVPSERVVLEPQAVDDEGAGRPVQ